MTENHPPVRKSNPGRLAKIVTLTGILLLFLKTLEATFSVRLALPETAYVVLTFGGLAAVMGISITFLKEPVLYANRTARGIFQLFIFGSGGALFAFLILFLTKLDLAIEIAKSPATDYSLFGMACAIIGNYALWALRKQGLRK